MKKYFKFIKLLQDLENCQNQGSVNFGKRSYKQKWGALNQKYGINKCHLVFVAYYSHIKLTKWIGFKEKFQVYQAVTRL